MKISYGDTYKEAVMNKPATCIGRKKFENGEYRNFDKYKILLDYSKYQKNTKYDWVRCHVFCYKIRDRKDHKLIVDDNGKQLNFTSIKKAMEWIYEHDKEFYEQIPNLSRIRG